MNINWQAVESELELAPLEADTRSRLVYLGTIMTLTPSGKYYTPFAHSNVEVCDACQHHEPPCDPELPCSTTQCCEACKDAAFWLKLETEAEKRGLFVTTNPDCPTDVLIGQLID